MKLSKKKMNDLMLSTMLAINPDSISQRGEINDPLKGLDIDKEYALIQQKACKLSSSMREMVCFRYETIQAANERKAKENGEEE